MIWKYQWLSLLTKSQLLIQLWFVACVKKRRKWYLSVKVSGNHEGIVFPLKILEPRARTSPNPSWVPSLRNTGLVVLGFLWELQVVFTQHLGDVCLTQLCPKSPWQLSGLLGPSLSPLWKIWLFNINSLLSLPAQLHYHLLSHFPGSASHRWTSPGKGDQNLHEKKMQVSARSDLNALELKKMH